MLSALMVHIYHLHTAMPADVNAQRRSILACMDALERLSELWLVGKMVHDLFETVLAFDGIDLSLKQKFGNDRHQKLTGMEFDLEELTVDESSTPESQTSEKVFKSLPLTPSLVAHMDAALKSAATPSKAGPFLNSSYGTSSSESLSMGKPKGGLWRPLAPRNDYHGEHHSTWMNYELPSTPGTTGLNAAEWLVYFHYLKCFNFFLPATDMSQQVPIFWNSVNTDDSQQKDSRLSMMKWNNPQGAILLLLSHQI